MPRTPPPPLYPIQYRDIVRRALREDLGRAGDLTTDAVIDSGSQAVARVVARGSGRVAGVPVVREVYRALDRAVQSKVLQPDGSDAEAGNVLLELAGPVRALLTGERTALNFMAHLSGIATLTRCYVDAVRSTGARIVCTRKTTPGLRSLEKYAVRCGGGANHRFGLDDAVLIKDNHVAAAGGVREAVTRARAAVGHTVKLELEVDTLEQLEEALELDIDAVLLDNMPPEELRVAVARVEGRVVTEASGGVTLDTVAEIAATGVDLISVGALTHSAPALDLSLEIIP